MTQKMAVASSLFMKFKKYCTTQKVKVKLLSEPIEIVEWEVELSGAKNNIAICLVYYGQIKGAARAKPVNNKMARRTR